MTVVTDAINDIDIERVLRKGPSSAGGFRDVYFIGDSLVLKVNQDRTQAQTNRGEFGNYNRLKSLMPMKAKARGIEFEIRIPEMAMVGEFLFAERVHLPHLPETPFKCWNSCEHEGSFEPCNLNYAVWEVADTIDLYDIHEDNYCWDADTKTAWIIDLGY